MHLVPALLTDAVVVLIGKLGFWKTRFGQSLRKQAWIWKTRFGTVGRNFKSSRTLSKAHTHTHTHTHTHKPIRKPT